MVRGVAFEEPEQEFVALERQYWQAIKDGDAGLSALLSADPCVVTGGQGAALLPRATIQRMFGAAEWKLVSFELTSPFVQKLTDDVVVIAYKVREELIVDGEELTLYASDTSTWIRRDGRWQCAAHTEALLGDPFGRDRRR